MPSEPTHKQPDATPLVSVIVPARNAERRLPRLLDALGSQTLDRDRYEVLVVDDASSDGTFEAIEASGVATPIRLDEHGGPYVGRNAAAAAARGRVLAFTDTDCDPVPDWLERGVDALERLDADLVVGKIDMLVDAEAPAVALVDFIRNFDQESSAERGFGATANLFVRRETFDSSGGFNAALMAGGDSEFGQRAVATGARIAYADDCVVRHAARRRPRQLARKAFRKGFGLAQRRRHADGVAPARVQPCSRPGYYVPHRHLAGFDRVRRSGLALRRSKVAAMHACSYLFFQLPLVAGNLAGTLSERVSLRAASRLR